MDLRERVESYREEMIRSIQELVFIPSVKGKALPGKPFGEDIGRALEYALNLAAHLGFRVKNLDGYAGYAEFGEGKETLAILAHLDVVPPGDGWTYPPFSGQIHDGKIYGRGTIDDKGPAIAVLYAMKAVMDSKAALGKKVRLILGTDEESGWKDMEYYFKHEPMPELGLTPDANYPVIHAEKGILHISLIKEFTGENHVASGISRIEGGSRANMVPDSCKCVFNSSDYGEKVLTHMKSFREYSGYKIDADFSQEGEVVLKSVGISAHASTPEKGENAISQMLACLATLGLGDSELENFVLTLNDKIGTDITGRNMGIDFKDDVSGKLTLNLGVIEVDRQAGKATIDIRYPVKYTKEQVIEGIKNALEGTGINVKIEHSQDPLYIPNDHFLVQTLMEVYNEETGQALKPLAIGGGTYARALKTGVAFGAVFPGKPELAHQKDEYIEIEDLMLNAKIYAKAIAQLAK